MMSLTILVTVFSLILAMQYLIVRPLKRLVTAVDEIGSGKLNPHIDLSTNDELGQLATRFKDMGEKHVLM